MNLLHESYKKYYLCYRDRLNNLYKIRVYALDAFDALNMVKKYNSYIKDHPNSVQKIYLAA